jgi:hypothetical protein
MIYRERGDDIMLNQFLRRFRNPALKASGE